MPGSSRKNNWSGQYEKHYRYRRRCIGNDGTPSLHLQTVQKITIIEQNAFPEKILSTRNGRCNYTNFVQTSSCYRSDDPQFPWQVIRQFDEQKTVGFLRDLGICPKERNGYLYPNSDQAQAVARCFVMECERLSIQIRCS